MKLTTIAIDGYRHLSNLRLTELSPTLNVIYGEKGSGKTRLADFLNGILFGVAGKGLKENEACSGIVEASNLTGHYQLSRTANQQFSCVTTSPESPAEGHAIGPAGSIARLDALTGNLDAATYDAIFDVSFSQPHSDEKSFAGFLHHRMNVPIGVEATGDASSQLRNTETANRLRHELNAAQTDLADLQAKLTGCRDEIARIDSTHSARVAQLESDIAHVTSTIAALNTTDVTTATIDAEILDLQQQIDNAQPTYVETPVSAKDLLAGLYAKLDEVDTQLRRWVSVQNDVQQQRIRLKDEMLLWNQMTLDSESHPYHQAREILLGLEHKVDHAQSQTAQWLDTHGPIDSQQAATFVEDVCNSMRDDLYQLCNELSQQYKHIRHKSAATELKQLRRCYEEMAENTQRLATRRDIVVEEIRRHDPVGADAIIRSASDFCNCAHHEGFLKARQRYVGDVEISSLHREVIAPDVSAQRNRIAALELQRAEIVQNASAKLVELNQLRSQEQLLVNELQTLRAQSDSVALQTQRRTLEAEIVVASERVTRLTLELERLPTVAPVTPDPILTSAAKLLTRLSGGDLVSVWLDVVHATDASHINAAIGGAIAQNKSTNHIAGAVDLQVRDRFGKVFNSSALSPSLRDITRLSLVLASKQQLANRGIHAPLVIDELFGVMESARVGAVLEVVSEFATLGQHQVLLLTQHRFLVDRVPHARWFDIENRPATAAAYPAAPTITPRPVLTTPSVVQQTVRQNVTPTSIPPTPVPSAPAARKPQSDYRADRPILSDLPPATIAYDPSTVRPSSVEHSNGSANSAVTSIGADQIGDRLESAVSFHEGTRLAEIPVFDALQLRTIEESGIFTVAQFLAFSRDEIPRQWLEIGLGETLIDNLQSEIWLLTCVPALRPTDAHVLVACGITEPEQLETSDAQALFERIDRYLNAHENTNQRLERISRSRVSDWHRGLSRTRSTWQQRGRRSDASRDSNQNNYRNNYQSDYQTDYQSNRSQGNGYSDRRSNEGRYNARSTTARSSDRSSRSQGEREVSGPRLRKFSPDDRYEREPRPNRDSNRYRTTDRDRGTGRVWNGQRNSDPSGSWERSPNNRSETQDRNQSRDQSRDRDRTGSRQNYTRPEYTRYNRPDDSKRVSSRGQMPQRNGDLARQSETREYDRDYDRNYDQSDRNERTRESNQRAERSEIRSPRFQGPTPDSVRRSVPALAPQPSRETEPKPAAKRSNPKASKSKSKYKFYLDLDDHIEAAPSIGPKTAERFEKIGVKTISEFLKQTADSMATKLNYKRISADVIRSWQHQARLVCRIPNLRGHDAQILVACEMLDPEEIAVMQPQDLFASVGPFSDTKEGQKIIRSGKKPDLDEVSDWIAWAQKTRSIQAA